MYAVDREGRVGSNSARVGYSENSCKYRSDIVLKRNKHNMPRGCLAAISAWRDWDISEQLGVYTGRNSHRIVCCSFPAVSRESQAGAAPSSKTKINIVARCVHVHPENDGARYIIMSLTPQSYHRTHHKCANDCTIHVY